MKKISIVIPVYNKGHYLEECLNSVLCQTEQDFEVICIDDGSRDNSRDILERFCKKDDRVSVIYNKENRGAGFSRNIGMSKSDGEFLLFLDADNIYSSEMVEVAYKKCKEDKLDVLHFNVIYFDNTTGNEYIVGDSNAIVGKYKNRVLSDEEKKQIAMFMSVGPYTTCIRKEFIKNRGIRFLDLSNNNDAFFLKAAYLLSERLEICDFAFCKNRINIKDQLSSKIKDIPVNISKTRIALKELCIENGIYRDVSRELNTYWATQVIACLYSLKAGVDDEIFSNIKRMLAVFLEEKQEETLFNNDYQEEVLKEIIATSSLQCFRINYYDYCLSIQNKRIKDWRKFVSDAGAEIVIWGYGKYGRFLKTALINSGLEVKYIVDVNHERIESDEVVSPDVIVDSNYLIIVSNSLIYNGVVQMVKKINEKALVFDFMAYFTFGIPLDSCVS